MFDWIVSGPSVLASFMASMVEFVEALTIVLAVGVVRGWRSALAGTTAGLLLVVVLIAVLGTSLSAVPLPLLQFVVGVLLLMFGLRWLNKAILRAAGIIALHDERKIFAAKTRALELDKPITVLGLDNIAALTAFKAVVLEGMEVVFIVIALGANGRLIPAAAGAGLALVVVVILGLCLHRPLANVPENTLKFGVGVLLSAFGTFWVGEGIGLNWPGQDWIILALIAVFLAVALSLVRASRHQKATYPQKTKSTKGAASGMLSTIASALLGLFVEDLWLAIGLLLWIVSWWIVGFKNPDLAPVLSAVFVTGLVLVLGVNTVHRARKS
jgi:uncharacterized membrane protein